MTSQRQGCTALLCTTLEKGWQSEKKKKKDEWYDHNVFFFSPDVWGLGLLVMDLELSGLLKLWLLHRSVTLDALS